MLIEHEGVSPSVDPAARVAPTATLVGDVTVESGTSIGYGVVVNAESGPVHIGADCIIMDGAILRGIEGHPLRIHDRCLVGPLASLSGCTIEEEVFLATGVRVFNGAHVGPRSEVRINAVVHIRTRLEPESMVPIGWVAVGNPAKVLPPDEHDLIWEVQSTLNFPSYVFGVERPAAGESLLATTAPKYSRALRRRHEADQVL